MNDPEFAKFVKLFKMKVPLLNIRLQMKASGKHNPDDIFLNWIMPGKNLHSKLNVFASAFKKPEKFSFNTGINGGNRAIVPVGSYEEIIPLDILMTQLLKALVVGDIEVAIDLGMLELTAEDLALATYVCPSKYDYCSILMDNLNKVYEEL